MDKDIRYVAAKKNDPTTFIARDVTPGLRFSKHGFKPSDMLVFMTTNSITAALKAPNKSTIYEVIRQFKQDKSSDDEFIVLPVEISYRVIADE